MRYPMADNWQETKTIKTCARGNEVCCMCVVGRALDALLVLGNAVLHLVKVQLEHDFCVASGRMKILR